MVDILKHRLVDAAKATEGIPGMRVEIVSDGVRLVYGWLNAQGFWVIVENHTPWQQIEENERSPLPAAMTSLTKQAGAIQ